MEATEALKILSKVSAIWNRQSTDEAVQAEWIEALEHVSCASALDTVRSIRNLGQKEPPTPGEVYLGARERDDRIYQQRAPIGIEDHSLPAEEGRRKLREIIEAVSRKCKAR